MNKKLAGSTLGLGAAALINLGGCHPAAAPAAKPAEVTTPAAAPDAAPTPPTDPAAGDPVVKPNCQGDDKFTEACGYASPTRYAVLDPKSIVNA